jgi:hypothetical protein
MASLSTQRCRHCDRCLAKTNFAILLVLLCLCSSAHSGVQRDTVAEAFKACRLPLYVQMVIEKVCPRFSYYNVCSSRCQHVHGSRPYQRPYQAMSWSSFSPVERLPQDLGTLIESRLDELEEQHGQEFVTKALGYVGESRAAVEIV